MSDEGIPGHCQLRVLEHTRIISELQNKARTNEKTHDDISANLRRIWGVLDEIKDDMERRLPLWVTVSLPLVFSVLSGTIVYLATN